MQQKDRIKELSQLMRDNGIKVLEVKNKEEEIKIELFPFKAEDKSILSLPDDYDIISAPIMGLGYIKPSEEAHPFVTVGDKVKKGDVLCIIEAMKVMNEIVAQDDCEIHEVCFENGKIVEFGQALFKIKRIDESDVL